MIVSESLAVDLSTQPTCSLTNQFVQGDFTSDDDFEMNESCRPRQAKASDELVVKYINAFRDMMVHTNQDTDDALRKAISRMEKLRNANSVNTALHTFASECSMKRGRGTGKIPVQPSSRARRRAGLSRGAATVGKGRPSSSLPSKKPKRKRNLAQNISSNVANAKSH